MVRCQWIDKQLELKEAGEEGEEEHPWKQLSLGCEKRNRGGGFDLLATTSTSSQLTPAGHIFLPHKLATARQKHDNQPKLCLTTTSCRNVCQLNPQAML